MWLTLAAAGFFGIIVLITLLRAEKSVANGALTVITLLAIGVAGAAIIRGFGPGGPATSADRPSPPATTASLPALACVDDLAGDTVLIACEKIVFGSADSTAAAISYAASRISRLVAAGDTATANRNLTPELESLRRAVERDRYGLMAYVLVARDHCTAAACPAFRSLMNNRQISPGRSLLRGPGAALFRVLERAAAGRNRVAAGIRDTAAGGDADRQADQCRFPVRGIDAAGQHHDA